MARTYLVNSAGIDEFSAPDGATFLHLDGDGQLNLTKVEPGEVQRIPTPPIPEAGVVLMEGHCWEAGTLYVMKTEKE